MFLDSGFFDLMPIIVIIGFIIVIITIIVIIGLNVKTGISNSRSPILTVPAKIVSKRTDVQGDHSYTTYYVTFEVESNDRMELTVKGEEYGLLAEQDIGVLSFQGTRYLSFERRN